MVKVTGHCTWPSLFLTVIKGLMEVTVSNEVHSIYLPFTARWCLLGHTQVPVQSVQLYP